MTTTSTDSLYYTGSYNFSWKRPIFANKKDFYIPSAATFEFARDVKTSESLSDTYQLKSSIVYTSFNIFGRNGSLPIAKWFIDDEYISSFTYILKKSRTEDNLFKQIFSCYTQANLYITKTDVLKSGIEFQIEDEHNWEGKGSVVWKRQGKFSPLLQIAKIFSKKLDTSKVPLIRTDSFNCTFSESSSSTSTKYTIRNYQSYELIHKLDMQVSKYASVNTSIAGSYSCVKDSICTLSFILGIGGRLEF